MERMESAHTYLRYVKAPMFGRLGGGRKGEGGLVPGLGFRIGPLIVDGESSVLGVSRPLFSSRKGNALPDRGPRLPLFLTRSPSRHPGGSLEEPRGEGGNARGRCFTSREEPCRRASGASRPCTRHRAGI